MQNSHLFHGSTSPARFRAFCFTRLFFLLLAVVQATPAFCSDSEPLPFNFDNAQTTIKELSRQIKSGQVSSEQIESARQRADQFSRAAAACIDASTGQFSRLDQELSSLGTAADHEPAEIVKERKSLIKQKQALQGTVSECRLVSTLATRLQNELSNQNKLMQTATFFSKSPSFFGRNSKPLPSFTEFETQISRYAADQSGLQELSPLEILIILLLAAAGGLAGLKLFQILHNQLPSCRDPQSTEQVLPLKGGMVLSITIASLISGCYLLYILQGSTSAVYGPWILFSISLYSFSLFLFDLRGQLRQKTAIPSPKAVPILPFRLLTFLCILLFFSTHFDLTDFKALESPLALAQSAIITGICLVGWWFLWSFRLPARLMQFEKSMRAAVSAASIFVIIIENSGYRNFSIFLLIGFFSTFILSNLLRFTLFSIDEIIGGFLSGKHEWQQKMRHWLGLSSQKNLMGIMWLRIIFKLLAWSIALFYFLQIWGLPEAQRLRISTHLVNGFNFGGLIIAPARIMLGFFIFTCCWTLISWIKIQLEKKWLKQSYFSRSAKETLVTMTGYAGFALALIIGLSVAGVSFSNLAVIAGALSVGIGFGLQNIVNNFVSGLIILFERPVKRGDWIRVGNTEGYVQKISVRSTVIQTFDRSDVIVPNSELISNQVTNMMLNDNYGRLIIPIGVAYGSDTDLVRTLLLEIAGANDRVMNDGSAPEPQVLFLEFGESSLNFELRCHLANIDERLKVKSAINYEIERAFRKHNISIPFPQRDLNIKEFPVNRFIGEDKPPSVDQQEGESS
jgi:potassium-dependent mechanosensitive channel